MIITIKKAENEASAHAEYEASVRLTNQSRPNMALPIDGNVRHHFYLCPIGQTMLIQFYLNLGSSGGMKGIRKIGNRFSAA
jgi:hypothetical protein